MDVIELSPRLHLLRFPVGQACLGRDGGELTLVSPRHPSDGAVMPGVFNLDRPQVLAACRLLAELDADVACFGHGDPVTSRAGRALRNAAPG
ncbi:hypothetical protein ACWCQ0_38200 [Streptomyces massasporeus]|uniref:MBL fold metallo-hydrolase n=1 Tax=Streptomyces massasporeus TaxID=67324 RepID=A0ABW6LFN9_9ACTN